MVDEEYKSLGVGLKIMKEIENSTKKTKSKLVALATRRAQNFYKKIGYEESAIYFRKLTK
jgi:ribosomal protein S18 acetylase RimI-like enzyme